MNDDETDVITSIIFATITTDSIDMIDASFMVLSQIIYCFSFLDEYVNVSKEKTVLKKMVHFVFG